MESPKPINSPLPDTQTEGPKRKTTVQTEPALRSPRNTEEIPRRSVTHRLSTLTRTLSKNMTPEKPLAEVPPWTKQVRSIVTMSWLNLLLFSIPVSWALHFAHKGDTIIFVFSFLAIIPLAKMLGFATEELGKRVGQTVAGLLNATLGNAVELIVSIIALTKCELQVVQSSLVGSILSNLLLVLGMCFFAGGTRFSEQGFGHASTQLNSSLLTISVIAVLLPAGFHFATTDIITDDGVERTDLLGFSHGVAIILLFVYGCYLVFQLFSHKQLYDDDAKDKPETMLYKARENPNSARRFFARLAHKRDYKDLQSNTTLGTTNGHAPHESNMVDMNGNPLTQSPGQIEMSSVGHMDTEANTEMPHAEEEDDTEKPLLSLWVTFGLLVVVTVLVAVTAEFLVDSIDGLTKGGNSTSPNSIKKEWVGLILLPIVGNAAEHVTAVSVSVKDKLQLSLGVAVGSSIQIALFVIPFTVVLGWWLGKPLTMLFDPFESIVLFLSVLIVNYTIQDGKSNWLEGMILMCVYLIIAVTFWYYPGNSITQALSNCPIPA